MLNKNENRQREIAVRSSVHKIGSSSEWIFAVVK